MALLTVLVNGTVLVMLLTVVSFVFLLGAAMLEEVLRRTGEHWLTVLGTVLAIGAAIALMLASVNSTSALRREVGDVRKDINKRIDGVQRNMNARIDSSDEQTAAGFDRLSEQIAALRSDPEAGGESGTSEEAAAP